MGTTFSAYLLGIRLEKMKELLVNTTISQRDIAEQVGIGSTVYGMLPRRVSEASLRRQYHSRRDGG